MNTRRARAIFLCAALGLPLGVAQVFGDAPPLRHYVSIPGAASAYHWQGALHVHDDSGFRRLNGPWVVGRGLRVAAIGDSYTYGYGVSDAEAWPARLARITGADVVNLGKNGDQSADLAARVHRLWGQLLPIYPDVVVYAACLNDAWPGDLDLWWFHVPESPVVLVRWYARRLPLYRAALDRHSDIDRFSDDVRAMRIKSEAHGAKFVAAVFDNFGFAEQRDRLERAMTRSGASVIRFRLPPGDWRVSRWEQHPNAAAHQRFAETIAEAL